MQSSVQTTEAASTKTCSIRGLFTQVGKPDVLSGKKAYYIAYTVCFAVFAAAAFAYLFAAGRSLIWNADGLDQHFTFFCYIGSWIREAVSTGTLPLWNYSMGYGGDIITNLASWIGEPTNIFSALCPEAYSEYLYQVLVIVRLFAAGWAFSLFCRWHKCDGFSTLLGSLAYAFCGFCLVWGALRHPMFIDAAIYLPLVLLGADKIFKGENPAVFMVSLAFTFFTYFYFAYMIGIFLFLFCLMRYFMGDNRQRSIRDFAQVVGRFAGYTLVSIATSAVLLLPIVMFMVGMDRLSADVYVQALRPLGFYALWPLTIAGGDSSSRGMAMEPLVSVCLLVLFVALRGKRFAYLRQVKVAFLVLSAFALIPWFGHFLNGMSYVSDRWMFAYAFVMAYALVLVMPHLPQVDKLGWRHVAIAVVVLEVLFAALLLVWFNTLWIIETMVMVAVTFVALRFVSKNQAILRPCALVLLLVGVGAFATIHIASPESKSDTKPYLSSMTALGKAYSTMYTDSVNQVVSEADVASVGGNGPLYRYDKTSEITRRNSSVLADQMSIDFYSSICSEDVNSYRTLLATSFNSDLQDHQYYFNDSRAFMDANDSVKYYLINQKNTDALPYGYSQKIGSLTKGKNEYGLYESAQVPSLGRVYTTTMSSQDFLALTPLQRQEALLQTCVMDSSTVPTQASIYSGSECPFTVDDSSTVAIEDGRIKVTESDGKLVLNFDGTPNAESYVYFDNLDFKDYFSGDLLSAQQRADLSVAQSLKNWISDNQRDLTKTYSVVCESEGIAKKTIRCDTNYCNFYSGRHTWLINMGYTEQAQNTITITFPKVGEYSFDGLQVLTQSMSNLDGYVQALNADAVDVELGTNVISGHVSASTDELVYLSVPYSTGWQLTIDGQPAEVMKANMAFMAFDVGAGDHDFELTYRTPYLIPGAIVSFLGIVGIVLFSLFSRRKSKT